MIINQILPRFKGVKKSGKGWTALCPAHGDKKNSLSINEGDDGKILLKCLAGCLTKNVVQVAGIKMQDLFPNKPETKLQKNGNISLAELARDKALPEEFLRQLGVQEMEKYVRITYLLEDSSPASRQRNRTALKAKDGSFWAKGNGLPVAYGLWKLDEARKEGYLILVEGESDCWTLWHYKYHALGLPGAEMAKKIEAPYLKDITTVYVIQESDKGGKTFVNGVTHRLKEIQYDGEICVVSMPVDAKDPNELHKQDPAKFKEKFQALIDDAKKVNLDKLASVDKKEAKPSSSEEQNKPVIRIIGGQLPEMVDQAEQALLASPTQLFQRNGMLVRIVESKAGTGIRRAIGGINIAPVEMAYLVETFTKAARWQKYDARSEKWIDANCPSIVGETYLARQSWNVPVLSGVIEAPTLRPDGTILDKPGYDESTGLFFHKTFDFPPIPENPSIEDAQRSLEFFKEIFCDFSFVASFDFSVALAANLTSQVRFLLPTAPIFGITAPKMESGKSLLANIPAMITTGRSAAMINQAANAEEENKRLLSILLAGDQVVCVDNIERPFSSADLCTIISEPVWQGGRILGKNSNPKVSTQITFLATGNNLVFQGDLTTRALICSLDPQCEQPGARKYKKNLHKFIPENRGKLVVAGLTILRAYHVAGRPSQNISSWSRFEDWSNLVRSAIVWLGLADPCLSRQKIESADPVRESLRNFLESWYSVFQENESPVKDAITKAKTDENFRDVLMEIAGEKEEINARRLGKFIQKHANRIEGSKKIETKRKDHNKTLWRVVTVESTPVQLPSATTENKSPNIETQSSWISNISETTEEADEK